MSHIWAYLMWLTFNLRFVHFVKDVRSGLSGWWLSSDSEQTHFTVMGDTLSHQGWWYNLPRIQSCTLFSERKIGGEGMHRVSLLVYTAPGDPLPAATSIITLEECRTLVLNSLWPPCWRRSGGGHSPRGGGCMQSVGAGWVLSMCVWWPREKPTSVPADPQHSKQDLHGMFTM